MSALIALLLAGWLHQQPVPENCPEISQTYAEGTSWEFVLTDDKGAVYKTYQYKVEEVSNENERLVYAIKYTTLNKKGKEEDKGYRNIIAAADQYLVNIETILVNYNSDNANYMSLSCNPQPGDDVPDVRKVTTYTVDNLGQKSYVSNKVNLTDIEYGERTTITTPLGELDCIMLTYKVTFDLQDFTYTDWIDSSFRTVKREILDKKGKPAFTGMITTYSN